MKSSAVRSRTRNTVPKGVHAGRALHRPGTAKQKKGVERLHSILEAARLVLMEAGYGGFTMRKVALKAGISNGNLTYYYRTKEDLLRALMEHVVSRYMDTFEILRVQAGSSPRRQLESVLRFWIDDLGTAATTTFFPELWALANHDAHVAKLLDELYAKARQPLNELIAQINPPLRKDERERIALLMCAAMEGLTIFAGKNKPWSRQRAALREIAVGSFMQLVSRRPGGKPARRAKLMPQY